MLPEDLRRAAEREARQMGLSLGELIRRRLSSALKKQVPEKPAFFKRTAWTDNGPKDLAENHDKYLYGA